MRPDFETMTLSELKTYAKENSIDLGSSKSKTDVLKAILDNQNEKEATLMSEQEVLTGSEEMKGTEIVGTDIPAGEVKAEDKRIWKDLAGNEVSMSQFIREMFTKNNLSRKDISDKFEINYRTVYGATVNMENDAEPASRGRGVVNPKIQVTVDNKVAATRTEGTGDTLVTKYFLNNEEITAEAFAALETVETDRNAWIKEQVAANVNRGDVAKALDLSYGVVYGLTKEEDGTRQKYEVELPDGTKMARSEYIRKRVTEGVSKSDVAKELGVEYSVVWQATKKDKSDKDKLVEAIEAVAKFADKIESPEGSGLKEAFIAAVEALKAFNIVEEVVAEVAPEGTPATV